jgi:hypothetical protein
MTEDLHKGGSRILQRVWNLGASQLGDDPRKRVDVAGENGQVADAVSLAQRPNVLHDRVELPVRKYGEAASWSSSRPVYKPSCDRRLAPRVPATNSKSLDQCRPSYVSWHGSRWLPGRQGIHSIRCQTERKIRFTRE